MTTDFRALCAELTDVLDGLFEDSEISGEIRRSHSLGEYLTRARAALADEPAAGEPASVTGQFMPTDAELLCIAAEEIDGYGNGINPGDYEPSTEMAVEAYGSELCAYARAVLARWGNPAPQPPAEGEVAELVAELRMMASQAAEACQFTDAESLSRAADLLERQATACAICERERLHQSTRAADLEVERQAAPVLVSERLPGQEDCDKQGRCWWWRTDDADEWWELLCIRYSREYNARCGNARYTHWLPAHALPIPKQQETNNG